MRKIDFTCKKVTLSDMVQCNYDLNDSEFDIFLALMESPRGLSVKEIVERVNKDRTTVQKILTKLLKRNLVMKRQMNLDRGFMFVYFSKNKKDIIEEIEHNVDEYFRSLKESLNRWKESLNKD